jgi:3'(2'), 5'-bisphosphate nucleotidase
MLYELELQAARAAAEKAGRLILGAYAEFTAIPDARADITTDADRKAQEVILQHLAEHFPADAFCAEEATPSLRHLPQSGPRTWVVDPIDGTRGFAQKNGEFSVMIGLSVEGESVLGIVLEPVSWRVTFAVRGGGCLGQDGQGGSVVPCRVTGVADLAEATLVQSRSRNPAVPSRPAQALRPGRVLETHSAGVKLARVARGDADLYVNTYPNFHDWDICAGHILVAEAGGTVTGLAGESIHYGSAGASQRKGLLATNGKIHASAVEQLRRMPAEGK